MVIPLNQRKGVDREKEWEVVVIGVGWVGGWGGGGVCI